MIMVGGNMTVVVVVDYSGVGKNQGSVEIVVVGAVSGGMSRLAFMLNILEVNYKGDAKNDLLN